MKKISCMRYFIQLVRRDMALYEEDVGTKQKVYQAAIKKKRRKYPKTRNKFK